VFVYLFLIPSDLFTLKIMHLYASLNRLNVRSVIINGTDILLHLVDVVADGLSDVI